jgi:hypothetical protein
MTTQNEEKMRKEFECKFKPPIDIEWVGKYYAPRFAEDKSAVFTATVHNGMFESWKSAHASRDAEVKALQDQLEEANKKQAATELCLEKMREALMDMYTGNRVMTKDDLLRAAKLHPSLDALREHEAKVLINAKRDLQAIHEDGSCLCTSCFQFVDRNMTRMASNLRGETT